MLDLEPSRTGSCDPPGPPLHLVLGRCGERGAVCANSSFIANHRPTTCDTFFRDLRDYSHSNRAQRGAYADGMTAPGRTRLLSPCNKQQRQNVRLLLEDADTVALFRTIHLSKSLFLRNCSVGVLQLLKHTSPPNISAAYADSASATELCLFTHFHWQKCCFSSCE